MFFRLNKITKVFLIVTGTTLLMLLLPAGDKSWRCITSYAKGIRTKDYKPIRTQENDAISKLVDHNEIIFLPSETTNYKIKNDIVAYFLWCGKNIFRFTNYISILSVVQAVDPSVIVFLHTHDIRNYENSYNTWLHQLMETVPFFMTINVGSNYSCDNDIAPTIFDLFPHRNGSTLFTGLNTVIADFPDHLRDSSVSIGSARKGRNEGFLYMKYQKKEALSLSPTACESISLNESKPIGICVVVKSIIFPKDILLLNTSFGRLARKVVYHHPDIIKPHQNFSNLAPRVGHYIRFGNKRRFKFSDYLSILSALYVAGLEWIYIHGIRPNSTYFDKLLREENVTYHYMSEPSHVFGDKIVKFVNRADVCKVLTVAKYGGVSMDFDVFWTRRIPDELLSYDAVLGLDWVTFGQFPEGINLGIVVGKQNSFPLVKYISSLRRMPRPQQVTYIGMKALYKIFEKYPWSIFINPRLQVICFYENCHPPWKPNYIRELKDKTPGGDFDWKTDTFALHCTQPKPPTGMGMLENMLVKETLFAEVGRNILMKAGKLNDTSHVKL